MIKTKKLNLLERIFETLPDENWFRRVFFGSKE